MSRLADNVSPESSVLSREAGLSTLELIQRTWAELLDLDAVGPRDDFFEIGGHSLIVATATARLSERLGLDLPLISMFDAPTAIELAELIEELRAEQPAIAAGITPAIPDWVIPLQPEGSGRPIFDFPAGPSDMGPLAIDAQIAGLVGRRHPFWGFRRDHPDLDAARAGGVPGLARAYVEQMRAIQGAGPYLLFANCVGGYLAWETARQLLSMGEVVAGILFYEVPLRADFDRLLPGITPARGSLPWHLSQFYRPQALPVCVTHLMTEDWYDRAWWRPWQRVVRGAHETIVISNAELSANPRRGWREELIARKVENWIATAEISRPPA